MDDREVGQRIAALRRELDDLASSAGSTSHPPFASTPAPRTRSRVRRSLIFAVLALSLAVPGVVLASHQFSDVPNSNTFHNSISNIKIAGITGGCGGTKYCPSDPVTRGQMAAFLNRGLGRGNVFLESGVPLETSYVTVVEGTIRTPGAGFVLANVASMAYTSDASGCPCEIDMEIFYIGTIDSSFFYGTTMPSIPAGGADKFAALSNTHVFAVGAGGVHTFDVEMSADAGTFSADATLTLVWVPFDDNGFANGFTTTSTNQPTQQKR
jgi:hypothetical protein